MESWIKFTYRDFLGKWNYFHFGNSSNWRRKKYKAKYRIPSTTFKTDGYDPKTNTIYEFLGDYWHGNPKVHDFDKVNVKNGFSFKELNQKTFERFDEIKKLGYNIKYIWENDYNKNGLDALITY